MLELMKNTWKKLQDNLLGVGLGVTGLAALGTYAIVNPVASIYIYGALALGAMSTVLYGVGSFLSGLFTQKAAPVAAAENQAPVEPTVGPSSAAAITSALNANPAPIVAAPVVAAPTVAAPVVAASKEEEVSTPTVSMAA